MPRPYPGRRPGEQSVQIEGSVRSNLIAAVAGARRWRGRLVHKDTADHWWRLVDYGRLVDRQPCGEAVADVLVELETALAEIKTA